MLTELFEGGFDMKKLSLLAGVLIGAAALGWAAPAVHGQQPTVAPVAKTPPSTPPAAGAKNAVPKASAKKEESVCKGLEEKPCRSNTECTWIAATKRQDGKDVKAYCRKKSGGMAQKTAKAAAAASKSAPGSTPAAPPATQPKAAPAPGTTQQKKQP